MKVPKLIQVLSIAVFMLLTSCQVAGGRSLFLREPSATPTLLPTNTPTITLTPTPSPTPTIAPTATATLTPTPAFITVKAGNVVVPILLYHHITSEIDGSRYNVQPAIFDQQMKWLSDNNYKTISITQLATLILNGGELPLRPVVITFDDGNKDIYQNAYPILQKYNFIATFYIVNQYINGENMITADQLQELISQGWEIGSHSDHHSDLTSENADLDTEVRLAKIALEKKLGVKIYTFAYPFGTANEAVVNKVYKAGFTSAAGLGESITHGRNNIYYLNRIEIQNEYSMEKFIQLMPWSGPLQ
jgi:peptidoglycan/xylan/chitin deacetylase (PgdA/CDA1 family)